MRIIVQEAASEIVLRSCSKEAAGKVRIYVILIWRGEYMQTCTYFSAKGFCWSQGTVVSMKDVSSFLDMRRCKNRAHKIGSEGNGTPLQYSRLENPKERRSLVGCSPWGREESDTIERLHFHFHALEKEMATHSSVLAWRIPWTEKPGGLPSRGSHRVRHDWSDLAAAAKIPNYLKACSADVPPSSESLVAELLSGHVENRCSSTRVNPCKCPWQAPVCSWQKQSGGFHESPVPPEALQSVKPRGPPRTTSAVSSSPLDFFSRVQAYGSHNHSFFFFFRTPAGFFQLPKAALSNRTYYGDGNVQSQCCPKQ